MHLRVKSAALLLLSALLLTGCGVRGSLQLPPEDRAAEAESNKAGPDGKPVHKPMILDGLLR
jgi:predicted small lipoprotein YifL